MEAPKQSFNTLAIYFVVIWNFLCDLSQSFKSITRVSVLPLPTDYLIVSRVPDCLFFIHPTHIICVLFFITLSSFFSFLPFTRDHFTIAGLVVETSVAVLACAAVMF